MLDGAQLLFALRKISSSNLLTEEDLSYISVGYPQIILPCEEENAHDEKFKIHFKKIYLDAFVVCLGILSTFHIYFQSTFSFMSTFDIGSYWILIIIFITSIIFILQTAIKKIHFTENNQPGLIDLNIFDDFLQSNIDFHKTLSKSLRFIQDTEVAAMGYTLITGKTPISRLERSKQKLVRECMQLRYQVLKSAVDSALIYRTQTLQMLEVCGDIEFNSAICQIPISELGPCFDQNASCEELKNVTDNFCLDILRDLVKFLFQQRSEFLKQSIIAMNRKCSEELNITVCTSDIFESFATIKSSCVEASEKLLKIYNMHLTVEKDLKAGSQMHTKTESSFKNSVNIALHSIQVHLRSALQVAIEAEESCEKVTENFKLLLEDSFLPQIQIHVDATNQCISEAIKHVQSPSEEDNEIPEVKLSTSTNNNASTHVQIDDSLLNNLEEIREDQVFEAITEDRQDNGENASDDDEDLHNIRKQRIEETTHVMKELKSVLHVKTSVEEREIRKCKLFPNYVPKPDNSVNICGDDPSSKPVTSSNYGDFFSLDRSSTSQPSKIETDNIIDFKGDGSLPVQSHKLLKLPRRPSAPGRNRRKQLSRNVDEKHKLKYLNTDEEELKPDENVDDDCPDPVPIGFGFPSLLASQAVRVAMLAKTSRTVGSDLSVFNRSSSGLVGEETTFGDSDSDNQLFQ